MQNSLIHAPPEQLVLYIIYIHRGIVYHPCGLRFVTNSFFDKLFQAFEGGEGSGAEGRISLGLGASGL